MKVNDAYKNEIHNLNLRNPIEFNAIRPKYDGFKHSFYNRTINAWNHLKIDDKQITDAAIFKSGVYDGSIDTAISYRAYIRRVGISSLISTVEDRTPIYTYH